MEYNKICREGTGKCREILSLVHSIWGKPVFALHLVKGLYLQILLPLEMLCSGNKMILESFCGGEDQNRIIAFVMLKISIYHSGSGFESVMFCAINLDNVRGEISSGSGLGKSDSYLFTLY